MRRCCCCVSVHAGAVVLGLLGVLVTALELVVLIPFLADMDGFNPIKENINNVYYLIENIMEEQHVSKIDRDGAMTFIQTWIWTSFLIEACLAGSYGLIAGLMAAGAAAKRRSLMLPYLIFQMVTIIVFILVGIVLCVVLFFVSIILGTISVGVFVVAVFLFIYFWRTVQKAYKELGNRDYMYSPAPVRPIYNPRDRHGQPRYQFHKGGYDDHTVPQQFNLE